MVTVSATEGSRTSTGVKRRSSAGSFSMCCRYSSWVVAPMQGNSPRASAALSSLAASCGPSPAAPAPMMVWTSSMNTTTRPPARRTSSLMPRSFSENDPRSCVPPPRWPCRARPGPGRAPRRPRCAAAGRSPPRWRSSRRRARPPAAGCWCAACRGRRWPPPPRARDPPAGSSLPAAASSVRFRPSCESQGKSFGSSAWGETRAARGAGAGAAAWAGAAGALAAGADPPRASAAGSRGLRAGGPLRRGRRARRLEPRRRDRRALPAPARVAPGRLGGRRAHLHRLQLAQAAGHARGEVGEGDVPQRGELQPAGGEQLVRRRSPHAAHGDEQVEAVHLLGADALGHVAGALAEVALDPLRLPGRAGHGEQDPVLVDAAVAQEHLGAVRHGEEGEELVRAGELLVDAPCNVLGFGEDLQELRRLDDRAHSDGRSDIGPNGSIFGPYHHPGRWWHGTPGERGESPFPNRPCPTSVQGPIDPKVRAASFHDVSGGWLVDEVATTAQGSIRGAERGSPDANPGEAPRPRGLESPGQVPGRLPGRHRWRPVLPARGAGALRGGVPGRAGAQPARVGLRPGLRGALRGRLPPRLHRRADHHPRAEADADRALRRRVDPPGHPGSPPRGAGAGGEPLRRPPPHRAAPDRRARGPTQGRGRRRGPGGARGGARPRAARLRGDRLRGVGGAGRDDALRHPGVPPAEEHHPRRGRQDPLAGRDAPDRARRSPPERGLAELRREGFEAFFLSVGVQQGRDSPSRASSSTAW